MRHLMNNFMTVQTSEGAQQDSLGAINRPDAWVNIEKFTNIKCHIQEKNVRDLVTERFSRTDEEHRDLIYHNNQDLYNYNPDDSKNQTQLRIIVNRTNPCNKLIFPVGDNDIVIYDFMGHIEQVAAVRNRIKFFIIRAQRNNRWSK